MERWCEGYRVAEGLGAPAPLQAQAEVALKMVVERFLECAMPPRSGRPPQGVSRPAYRVARESAHTVQSLEAVSETLYVGLDRLITSAMFGRRNYEPRLMRCCEPRHIGVFRQDPCWFLFKLISFAVIAAKRAEEKQRTTHISLPESSDDGEPWDPAVRGYDSTPPRRRVDESKFYVALRNVDEVYAVVESDQSLKECLGLLLLRETAKYTEFRHQVTGHRDLPILNVPGLTLGTWLDALDARDDVRAIDRELDRRYQDGVDDARVRVDGVPTTEVLAMIRRLMRNGEGDNHSDKGSKSAHPWNTVVALDQAVSRARSKLRAAMERVAAAGGDGESRATS